MTITSLDPPEGTHASGRTPRRRAAPLLSYRRRIQLWGFAFVLPTLLFLAVFKYGPMVWAIDLSFHVL